MVDITNPQDAVFRETLGHRPPAQTCLNRRQLRSLAARRTRARCIDLASGLYNANSRGTAVSQSTVTNKIARICLRCRAERVDGPDRAPFNAPMGERGRLTEVVLAPLDDQAMLGLPADGNVDGDILRYALYVDPRTAL